MTVDDRLSVCKHSDLHILVQLRPCINGLSGSVTHIEYIGCVVFHGCLWHGCLFLSPVPPPSPLGLFLPTPLTCHHVHSILSEGGIFAGNAH